MLISEIIVGLLVVIICTFTISYFYPNSSNIRFRHNFNRIYNAAYNTVISVIISIAVSIVIIYGANKQFKIRQENKSIVIS